MTNPSDAIKRFIEKRRAVGEKATPGPWRDDDAGYIWGPSNGAMIAEIRGWGYLTGKGHGALGLSNEVAMKIQQANGALISDARNSLPALLRAVEVLVEELREHQLNHEHNPEDESYRPMGDTYGWCFVCQTKVGLNEDTVRDALSRAAEILGAKE